MTDDGDVLPTTRQVLERIGLRRTRADRKFRLRFWWRSENKRLRQAAIGPDAGSIQYAAPGIPLPPNDFRGHRKVV